MPLIGAAIPISFIIFQFSQSECILYTTANIYVVNSAKYARPEPAYIYNEKYSRRTIGSRGLKAQWSAR